MLRPAGTALPALVRNARLVEPNRGDQAADVRTVILDLYDLIDDLPVDKTEAAVVLWQVLVGKPVHYPVVPPPQPRHQEVVRLVGVDPVDNLVSLLPLLHEIGNRRGRLLDVGRDPDRDAAG